MLLTPITLLLASGPPPLGPIPAPQPDCTTCKWPKHSWAHVPASVHTSRLDTTADGTFTAADLQDLIKFPLITMEKWQGQDAVDASGKRAFIWEEDAWSNAAAQIKSAAPDASVVGWTDTMLVYTGWRLDGNARHFRVAEYIEQYPELLVKNTSNQLAISQCGADFSSGDHNSVARNTVQDTMAFLNCSQSVAIAWQA
eukprot:gene22847-11301_t